MAHQEIVIAGFGGQGALSAGKLLAYSGMLENMHVSWLPSYGPEMRGGTANCHVIISDEPIGSPILNSATAVIAMNRPSLDKFEGMVVKNGLIVLDSSLIDRSPVRTDVEVYAVPASRLASEMGNIAYANMMLLGKLIARTGIVARESIEKALGEILPEKYRALIPDELRALDIGMAY